MLTDGMVFLPKTTVNSANHWGARSRHWLTRPSAERERERKLITLCQTELLITKVGGRINERLRSWLMGRLFEAVVNRTNHCGPCTRERDWHTSCYYRATVQTLAFFYPPPPAGRDHFLHSAGGIVTNYVSRIYDVRRNRATQLVEQTNVHISDSDVPTSAPEAVETASRVLCCSVTSRVCCATTCAARAQEHKLGRPTLIDFRLTALPLSFDLMWQIGHIVLHMDGSKSFFFCCFFSFP